MSTVPPHAVPAPVPFELSAHELRSRLPEALSVYVQAMGYPHGTEHHRAPMWAEHILRPGWRAIGAVSPTDGTLVAIAYGYRGAGHQWWHRQVRDGMRRAGWDRGAADRMLSDYFELTELHVLPSAQGHRLGESVLATLLDGRTERHVLLSTPEVAGEDNRAWRLYRRSGFRDVIRRFHFTGDTRPFAVLGRELPMTSRPDSLEAPL